MHQDFNDKVGGEQLWAEERRDLSVTERRVALCTWYADVILKGRLMFYVTRYFMSSNSPSDGMNMMVWRSELVEVSCEVRLMERLILARIAVREPEHQLK